MGWPVIDDSRARARSVRRWSSMVVNGNLPSLPRTYTNVYHITTTTTHTHASCKHARMTHCCMVATDAMPFWNSVTRRESCTRKGNWRDRERESESEQERKRPIEKSVLVGIGNRPPSFFRLVRLGASQRPEDGSEGALTSVGRTYRRERTERRSVPIRVQHTLIRSQEEVR